VAERISGKPLVDYSCGDSSGLSPEFPFNPSAQLNGGLKEPTSGAKIGKSIDVLMCWRVDVGVP
jgi:hypothetical protein